MSTASCSRDEQVCAVDKTLQALPGDVANGEVLTSEAPKPHWCSLSSRFLCSVVLVHYAVREECEQTRKCAPLMKHFGRLKKEVGNGEGFRAKSWRYILNAPLRRAPCLVVSLDLTCTYHCAIHMALSLLLAYNWGMGLALLPHFLHRLRPELLKDATCNPKQTRSCICAAPLSLPALALKQGDDLPASSWSSCCPAALLLVWSPNQKGGAHDALRRGESFSLFSYSVFFSSSLFPFSTHYVVLPLLSGLCYVLRRLFSFAHSVYAAFNLKCRSEA
ncbi:hypothetical protein D9619_011965 [Psilocybe cf. subviscida]|uniref:Uncharacterized protein n=1 Tax=Psilocybe cf. subviscida TaxID=2480587 RepID=A0A8H5EVY6_9AGAR|nr:hypothetical protein D9619_011965 [Psilocybe cf. subviscida]